MIFLTIIIFSLLLYFIYYYKLALNYLYQLFQLVFGCRHDEIEIEKILKRERNPQYLVMTG
jgi:hypothetical protein